MNLGRINTLFYIFFQSSSLKDQILFQCAQNDKFVYQNDATFFVTQYISQRNVQQNSQHQKTFKF